MSFRNLECTKKSFSKSKLRNLRIGLNRKSQKLLKSLSRVNSLIKLWFSTHLGAKLLKNCNNKCLKVRKRFLFVLVICSEERLFLKASLIFPKQSNWLKKSSKNWTQTNTLFCKRKTDLINLQKTLKFCS